jgi:hypothetical protein
MFTDIAMALKTAEERPYGPPVSGDEKIVAGNACKQICGGDAAKAISLWKMIQADLGYVPRAAAVALIRASNPDAIIPDVEAPEPS